MKKKQDKRWLAEPKLEGVLWEWADNWWDWVLAGACQYKGKRYYGLCVDENYNKRYKWWRRYLVIDLPPEVWQEELERQALFVEKVGDHFVFDIEKQRRKDSELKPYHLHHEFYDKYPPRESSRDYRQHSIIGWFECD